MDYDLNEQQHMIQEAAHKFLSKECPSEFVRKMAEDERGFTDELWKGMTDLGWMSLLVPEEYGGFGGDFLDLAVLLSEMGYFALPGPYFSTVVLGGLTLLEAGNEEQKREMLPELSQGKRFLTLAWVEKEGTFSPDGIQTKADAAGNGYVLSGTKLFVPDAHVADPIICAARTGKDPEQVTLFLVDPKTQGVTISPLETMAGDKQFEVVLENAEIPAEGVLGEVDGAWPVLRKVQMRRCSRPWPSVRRWQGAHARPWIWSFPGPRSGYSSGGPSGPFRRCSTTAPICLRTLIPLRS
ncbi:MAG: acyl-CoA/acyl-ACP dehydrogenase [Deltaproteobacteria bacterium]|nr:acyl-CoA/acyl-ACP dehydrogenase [Deltaproteobacteria bacterium]